MINQSMIILIMGVSGSGKTTIGKLLAETLHWEFYDADSFHSLKNVEKMQGGIPLTEADRTPWLQSLHTAIEQWLQENRNVVLACSALKGSYRQQLQLDKNRIKIIYLTGNYELIQKRLQTRHNHYMTEKLLDSQFHTLEEPIDAISVNVAQSPQSIVQTICSALGLTEPRL